jgi:hypothetical protein
VIRINNRVGSLYWAAVRLAHPWITRAAIARARPGPAVSKPPAP